MAILFSLTFVAVAKADGERIQCRIAVDEPTKMAPPYAAYEARIVLEGPDGFSRMMRGAHPFQVLELALFAIRTVLSLNARRWIYEDLAGAPLDFSYEGPDRD
ncbi:MAG TPA: hypothetical protein PLF78_06585 [Caulobacter sp.]|nr:hypothetical protein [Caulobacter sp.]